MAADDPILCANLFLTLLCLPTQYLGTMELGISHVAHASACLSIHRVRVRVTKVLHLHTKRGRSRDRNECYQHGNATMQHEKYVVQYRRPSLKVQNGILVIIRSPSEIGKLQFRFVSTLDRSFVQNLFT